MVCGIRSRTEWIGRPWMIPQASSRMWGERLVTIFHKPEVPLPAEGSSSHLHPDSKVTEMKRRLKELHAPVWGTKAQLWERLQEREAELEYHRSVERSKAEREEALNLDPEQARQPMVLEGPDMPSAVEP